MKVGVSSYSFNKYRNATGCNLFEIIDKAKEIGFDGIEFLDLKHYADGEDKIEFAKKVKAYCAEKDIEIPAYTVTANLLAENVEDVVKDLICNVDVAEALGAPVMRHDICYGLLEGHLYTWRKALEAVVPHIQKVADYAKEKGIKTCSENHGYIFQAPERVEALILAVNRDNYGWLLDMGNFVDSDADLPRAYSTAAPYTFHVHCKDFIYCPGTEPRPEGFFVTPGGDYYRGTVVGHGVIPVKKCLNALEQAKYDGYLSIEFEGWEECLPAIEAGHKYVRRLLTI